MSQATETKPNVVTVSHPFPWRVWEPNEAMDQHDVNDANGAAVLLDVDPDTAKALVESVNQQVALSLLTHAYVKRDPNAPDGPLLLEPGAIYELDAAGEAEIQRMIADPASLAYVPPGYAITFPTPDEVRPAALELALSKVIEIALPEEGGDQREWGLRCLGIHKVLMDCGLPDLADKVWNPADADMAQVGRLALSGAFEPKPDTRIATLEAALITAFSALEKATGDDFREEAEEDAILEHLWETLMDLGLTDRLPSREASRS